MGNNMDKPIAYIRKNREEEAIIYLKENDQKAAQRFLCYIHATDRNINVVGETTNIKDVKNCDIMLIASAHVLARNENEYFKIKRELKKNRIEIEIAENNGNIGDYLDMMVRLSRNERMKRMKK